MVTELSGSSMNIFNPLVVQALLLLSVCMHAPLRASGINLLVSSSVTRAFFDFFSENVEEIVKNGQNSIKK